MIGDATANLRGWLINLFIASIKHVSKEDDRLEILRWLELSRNALASDLSQKEKFAQLYALMNARKTAQIVINSVVESIKNYKNADLPLAVKVSIPVTLLAMPMIGGHGAGIAAFGSAIGLPVFVLFFLGTAGITSVIEAIASPDAKLFVIGLAAIIATDVVLRHIKSAVEDGSLGTPEEPVRAEMPEDEIGMRANLLSMHHNTFEKHVMSFFTAMDPLAAVTPPGPDGGIDGFAKHSNGKLIVVQCKHYAAGNPVGLPAIYQFRGAMEEYEAWRGYFVTTSRFTPKALNAAALSKKIVPVNMDELVRWHREAPTFQ